MWWERTWGRKVVKTVKRNLVRSCVKGRERVYVNFLHTTADGSSKLATAEDFTNIEELADEGEEEEKERLYQKGMIFVQSQTG